jgi:hypothetical protein
MNLARAYERRIFVSTPDTIKGGPKTNKSAPAAASSVVVSSTPRPRFHRLSPEELAAMRANGECYRCPEKYVEGHMCSSKGVFLLEMDDDVEPETAAEELGISLHSFTGIDITNTMQLHVRIKGRTLVALVDTGLTHTFIRDDLQPQLDLILTPPNGLTVKVANGEQVTSGGVCCAADLEIGTEHFSAHLYAFSLDGFDIVLGVQWLRTLGPILWDFNALTMSFWRDGQMVRWTGLNSKPHHCSALSAPHDFMKALLESFEDIFAEPHGLPPPRCHDHRIRLLPGTTLVKVHPYRYLQLLKDEIERQCDDMLQQGIIQECTSAFSSPMLLVRKTDATWRFCIDYRKLNQQTVKDKFLIPVVDELLDELRGVSFFTKVDLRIDYHQVRMHPDDIAKTAFRTHHDHFEFLVMPFGLTNAPSTFQALMNDVL